MDKLPHHPGTYALILELAAPQYLQVGRLGRFNFPAGIYAYLGSARGSGGIRARLGRHLKGGAATRWHIDYLRAVAQVRGYGYRVCNDLPLSSTECQWSQVFAALPGAAIPIPGFGASDCKSGCSAHLIHFLALDFLAFWDFALLARFFDVQQLNC